MTQALFISIPLPAWLLLLSAYLICAATFMLCVTAVTTFFDDSFGFWESKTSLSAAIVVCLLASAFSSVLAPVFFFCMARAIWAKQYSRLNKR